MKTRSDARRYIEDGPVAMYRRTGFGLYLVELKETGTPIGMCGLIKRDTLTDVDLGFAFLPAWWGSGYACESARAVLSYGSQTLGLSRIVAIVTHDNARSCRLLERLGFRFERDVRLGPAGDALGLYAIAPGGRPAEDERCSN